MSIEKLPINASLKQVMDKFEEISLMDLSSIDVKLYTKLPSEVKNGQLAILSDNTDLEIILSSKESDAKDNCVFCYIGNIEEDKKSFSIKNIKLYFKYIHKIVNNVKTNLIAYVGINGEWVKVVDNNLILYDNGQYPHYQTKGEKLEKALMGSKFNFTEEDTSLLVRGSSSGGSQEWAILSSINAIDLTNYSYLKIQIADYSISGNATFARLDVATNRTVTGTNYIAMSSISGNGTISLNVSNITSIAYCRVVSALSGSLSTSGNVRLRVKKMWLE